MMNQHNPGLNLNLALVDPRLVEGGPLPLILRSVRISPDYDAQQAKSRETFVERCF